MAARFPTLSKHKRKLKLGERDEVQTKLQKMNKL
jgi:hypothetical protein